MRLTIVQARRALVECYSLRLCLYVCVSVCNGFTIGIRYFHNTCAPMWSHLYSYSEFCSFANLTESSVIMSSVITKLSRLKKGLSQDVEDNTNNIHSQDKHWARLGISQKVLSQARSSTVSLGRRESGLRDYNCKAILSCWPRETIAIVLSIVDIHGNQKLNVTLTLHSRQVHNFIATSNPANSTDHICVNSVSH